MFGAKSESGKRSKKSSIFSSALLWNVPIPPLPRPDMVFRLDDLENEGKEAVVDEL